MIYVFCKIAKKEFNFKGSHIPLKIKYKQKKKALPLVSK
jgi:hypothetical protein